MEQIKPDIYETPKGKFLTGLRELINTYCEENKSDTPDYILASYLLDCLEAFNRATKERETWHVNETLRKAALYQIKQSNNKE